MDVSLGCPPSNSPGAGEWWEKRFQKGRCSLKGSCWWAGFALLILSDKWCTPARDVGNNVFYQSFLTFLIVTGPLFWSRKRITGDTPRSPQFLLRFPIPGCILALIHEKTALMFSKSRDSLAIRLTGAESKQKITANSIYLEAKLHSNGL